jgi:chain length determinant protein tyrosine kinase EpsG
MNDRLQILEREPVASQATPLTASTKIGPMLVAMGKLSPKDLNSVLATQKQQGLRFGDAAVKLGLVSAEDVNAILAKQFAYTQAPPASSKLDPRLTALFQPDSSQAEAIRSLRSELMLRYFNPPSGAQPELPPRRALAVVSAENPAAVALVTANLAISFAQLGLRTLLIDTNLRAPQLHPLFDLPEHAPGFSDWIAERAPVAPTAIEQVQSLWVMPAGTRAPNPQELLTNKLFNQRVTALSQRFDIALFNTTPMDTTRDAQLVAAQTGAALLVAQQNLTSSKALMAVSQRLRELGVRLLGSALVS